MDKRLLPKTMLALSSSTIGYWKFQQWRTDFHGTSVPSSYIIVPVL